MADTENGGATPPYASFPAFQRFINMLAERGVPSRVDRTVWQSDFSGSDGAHVTLAMKFLGLLRDDDTPTDRLTSLVDAAKGGSEAEVKARLRETLLDAYAPIVAEVDLKNGTYQELRQAFDRSYASMGNSSRAKADAFFRKAMEYTGALTSTYILKPPRGSGKRRKATKPANGKSEAKTEDQATTKKEGKDSGNRERNAGADAPLPRGYRTIPVAVPGCDDPVRIIGPENMSEALWAYVSDVVTKFLKLEAGRGLND